MNLLLDTTVLVDILRGSAKGHLLLQDFREQNHRLSISVVTVAELYAGLVPKQKSQMLAFLEVLQIYEVDSAIAVHAGKFKLEWARRGRTLALPDMFIAATAVEYDLVLLTDNRKDFPMPELKFYNPAQRVN